MGKRRLKNTKNNKIAWQVRKIFFKVKGDGDFYPKSTPTPS
jgi:hypothetical protein